LIYVPGQRASSGTTYGDVRLPGHRVSMDAPMLLLGGILAIVFRMTLADIIVCWEHSEQGLRRQSVLATPRTALADIIVC
jgi:hypothetical protein